LKKFVRDALVSEGIPAIYEPKQFPIHMNGEESQRVYFPDFVTGVFVNGKTGVFRGALHSLK